MYRSNISSVLLQALSGVGIWNSLLLSRTDAASSAICTCSHDQVFNRYSQAAIQL